MSIKRMARGYCQGISSGYDLISNDQWMTIAHEIEQIPSNWTGGIIYDGLLYVGHSEPYPNSLCDSSVDYVEANCVSSAGDLNENRRTHNLKNGTLWDLSGNAMEWVTLTLSDPQRPSPILSSYQEFQEVLPDSAFPFNKFLPANPHLDSRYGAGMLYNNFSGAVGGLRGGWFFTSMQSPGEPEERGIYQLDLSEDSTFTSPYVGFRCVYNF